MNMLTPKQQVVAAIATLPDEVIAELTHFVAYLQYKVGQDNAAKPQPAAPPNAIAPLRTDRSYEVWLPINAPEAANTLLNLLAAEQS